MEKEKQLERPPQVGEEIKKVEELWEEVTELTKTHSQTRRRISLYAGMLLVGLSAYEKQIKCLKQKINRESEKIRLSVIAEDAKKTRQEKNLTK